MKVARLVAGGKAQIGLAERETATPLSAIARTDRRYDRPHWGLCATGQRG
jgi:hypothetical protein